jgi:hypothetical protein
MAYMSQNDRFYGLGIRPLENRDMIEMFLRKLLREVCEELMKFLWKSESLTSPLREFS